MSYVFLVPAAYTDLRDKEITLLPLMLGITIGTIRLVLGVMDSGMVYLTCLIPGIVMLAGSVVTGEKIGKGDGIALLILGAILGYRNCVMVTLISAGLLFVFCVIGLAAKKMKKDTRIPFIPFLFIGNIIMGLTGI